MASNRTKIALITAGAVLLGWPVLGALTSPGCFEETLASLFDLNGNHYYQVLTLAAWLPLVSVLIGAVLVGLGLNFALAGHISPRWIRWPLTILAVLAIAAAAGGSYFITSFDRCFVF